MTLPPVLVMAIIVLTGACRAAGEDEIFGTYSGFLREADLDNGITVQAKDSSFTLLLERGEDGVAGLATIRGKASGPLGGFDGVEIGEIPTVNIDGTELWCTYKGEGFTLGVEGTFSPDFATLALDVDLIGMLFLDREQEPDQG
ncbi:MAG: hypothetical protein Q8P41_11035 [Pseudomonadota bacterium]|nr:hypothetical protein [Pseudomonadota bacterium]